jgi:chemotaxis signal transduction protein
MARPYFGRRLLSSLWHGLLVRRRLRRRSRLGRLARAEIAVLESKNQRLALDVKRLEGVLKVAEAEIESLSCVIARDRMRIQAETSEGARRIADAKTG